MSLSCDFLMKDAHKVHFSMIPKLGFIIINDMKDFGECWLKVKVEDGWKSNPIYNFRNLFGTDSDITRTCARTLIDVIIKSIHEKDRMNLARNPMTFVININLKKNNPEDIASLKNCLKEFLREKIPDKPINLLL